VNAGAGELIIAATTITKERDTMKSTNRAGLLLTLTLTSMIFPAAAEIPDTAESLQLMVGAPPPEERQVTVENGLAPPYNRWSFQRMRELFPTRGVAPSDAHVTLPANPTEISDVAVSLSGGRSTTAGTWLAEAFTDGFIVLHNGKVVHEQYLNGQQPATEHIMFSVSKSVTGTMILMLAEEGRIDLTKPVSQYISELAQSAYGDATVQQVMDMTNSIAYDETYDDPESDIGRYFVAISPGGSGMYAYLTTLKKQLPGYPHGAAFQYVTPDTEVLGWLIRRITGSSLSDNLQQRIWAPMGAEFSASYILDPMGIELAGAGLSMTLRDAARFGQMVLMNGRANGRQVISPSIAERIKTTRNAAEFSRYYDDPWFTETGEAYHDQWWSYAGVNAVVALGIHGQFIYVNSEHNVVIVKQSSDPFAEAERVDVETPVVLHAIAEFLGTKRE
jgi:CubicO group peptidase (beta-lactamase class C family)